MYSLWLRPALAYYYCSCKNLFIMIHGDFMMSPQFAAVRCRRKVIAFTFRCFFPEDSTKKGFAGLMTRGAVMKNNRLGASLAAVQLFLGLLQVGLACWILLLWSPSSTTPSWHHGAIPHWSGTVVCPLRHPPPPPPLPAILTNKSKADIICFLFCFISSTVIKLLFLLNVYEDCNVHFLVDLSSYSDSSFMICRLRSPDSLASYSCVAAQRRPCSVTGPAT